MRASRVVLCLSAAVLLAGAGSTACASTRPAVPTGATTASASATAGSAATAAGSRPSAPRRAHTARPAAVKAVNWPGYHGGGAHRGAAGSMPNSGALHVHRLTLDGAVYGSPIAVNGTIVVATENDSVYGFTTGGRQLWRHHLGTPARASQLPCGNIDPLGITGSPVFSGATDSVYVVAETGGGGVRHTLWALNIANGKARWHRSVDYPGRRAAAMQQRGALAIADSKVWVTFGGLAGDCDNYGGRLIGVPLRGKGAAVRYAVPTAREAGMWQPSGPSVDASGHLYVSVGNGAAGPGDPYDHSDSVLELNGRAQLLHFFAPREWGTDNRGDVDLGSVGPALVGTKWVVQGGKSDRVYVLRRDRLGGIGGQVSVSNICATYGGTAVAGSTVYLPCTDGVRSVRVDSTGHLHPGWRFARASGSPVIGGRRVWTLDQGGGVLYAVNPATGGATERADVGATSRFATPALYGRFILVPTMTGLTIVRRG